MSNYNISKKLIKKLKNDYHIDYTVYLRLLEYYNTSQFSTKYVYPQIKQEENKYIIDLSEIFNFPIEELDNIFNCETDLKLEAYKIMVLVNQLKKFDNQEMDEIARTNRSQMMSQRFYKPRLSINITLLIAPATGLLSFIKKDKIYKFLDTNERKDPYKDIYDYLLKSFEKVGLEGSKEDIKTSSKNDFNSLMSIFDMISI